MKFEIAPDATIRMLGDEAEARRPWHISLTGAAVHSGIPVTCFTKEGVRNTAFPNPLPDHNTVDPNAFPERRHFFVQMTEDGVLHNPPLRPEQAREWTAHIVTPDPVNFTYDPEHIIPEI